MTYIPGINDLQIAKNLGEMFENATRSFNFQFDPKNISLPSSVTTFINTNYYNIETKFSNDEIIKGLESNNDTEIYTMLKHLVCTLTSGATLDDDNNEIIQFFPFIIKNINSNNLKIRRLVYILLLQFNHLQQDISLLSINAIQKSLNDKNAINKSLSIRCLSGLKIPAILPILLLSIGKLIKDSSPLVRSACAISILKCVRLDIDNNSKGDSREYIKSSLLDESSNIYQLSTYLEILLSDSDAKVLSISISIFYEIFNGFYDILHNKINNLIKHFPNFDSFSKVNFINIIIEYSKLFFKPFSSLQECPIDLKNFYYELISELNYEMDYNVTISILKCIIILFDFQINELRLEKVLIKLIQRDEFNDINEDSKILICLKLVYYLMNKDLLKFDKNYQISNFLPLLKDNLNIFNLKILILFKLINVNNFNIIFKEFKFLIENTNLENIKKFKILNNLNLLILSKENLNDEQIDSIIQFYMNKLQIESNELLIGEYITGLIQLIQSNLSNYKMILIKLIGKLINSALLPRAKSSIIWILGEYLINEEHEDILDKFIPDLTRLLVKNFKNEINYNVRLEILIFVTKLLITDIYNREGEGKNYEFSNNNLVFKMFNYIIMLTKYDIELDIRDMNRLICSILPFVEYELGDKNFSIEEKLKDEDILNECVEKCKNIKVSILLFQNKKPEIINKNLNNDYDEFEYFRSTNSRLNLGYEGYYEDLRSEGFTLRDYSRYGGLKQPLASSSSASTSNKVFATSSSSASASSASLSPLPSSSFPTERKKYKLQTLDDFLGG